MRKQLLKSARLWVLSLICASVGAATVWATGSVATGVLAFLGALVVLGPIQLALREATVTAEQPPEQPNHWTIADTDTRLWT